MVHGVPVSPRTPPRPGTREVLSRGAGGASWTCHLPRGFRRAPVLTRAATRGPPRLGLAIRRPQEPVGCSGLGAVLCRAGRRRSQLRSAPCEAPREGWGRDQRGGHDHDHDRRIDPLAHDRETVQGARRNRERRASRRARRRARRACPRPKKPPSRRPETETRTDREIGAVAPGSGRATQRRARDRWWPPSPSRE
jgi:hypothetical protein